MAKRHRPDRLSVRQLDAQLAEVDQLLERKRWMEARDKLEELDRRYPDDAGILGELLNVNYELHDLRAYLNTCERLEPLVPDDPDFTLALAGAYMANVRPASALHTFRRFVQRWPQHERAAEARQSLTELEAKMDDFMRDMGLAGEEGMEIARLHERTLASLEHGQYRQVRETAKELLQRYPDFPPALNNIAQSYSAEGNLAQAIAMEDHVLAQHPDNFHALANMVHYHCLQGQFDQARIFAERLRSVQSEAVDSYTRKAEAASYLGEDQAVLEAFHDAERAGHLKTPLGDPLLFHLAAVAALRLGDEAHARQYWKQALDISAGFGLAKENLADLQKPIGERHAPWAFSEGNWISPRTMQDLAAIAKRQKTKNNRAIAEALHRFVEQHPDLVKIVPVLFDRGDPRARELALHIVKAMAERTESTAQTSELLTALRDFALSQRGPDQMRLDAARAAMEAELIPAGPVRMWTRGKWVDLLLLDYQFDDKPTFRHSTQVEGWLAESTRAEEAGDIGRAEELIRRALGAEPEAPDLLNNLATIYKLQGQTEKALELLRQLIEKHPDYSFPRINLAQYCIARGDLTQAETLLKPVLTRKHFNVDEFGFFCNAQIELLLAKHEEDGARTWLEMWSGIDPENPLVEDWEQRLTGRNPLRRLFGRP